MSTSNFLFISSRNLLTESRKIIIIWSKKVKAILFPIELSHINLLQQSSQNNFVEFFSLLEFDVSQDMQVSREQPAQKRCALVMVLKGQACTL